MRTQNTSNQSNKSRGIALYANGRIIGIVQGSVLVKRVSSSKHFLRKPPAIAISYEGLIEAKKAGASQVEVFDTDTNTTYKASLDHILKTGKWIERGGYEPQIALPLSGWIKQSKGQPVQLGLFGGMA